MQRFDALEVLASLTRPDDLFTSAVGSMWDDWWNLRPGRVDNTFSPAAIGSVTTLALGIALALPERRVVALDTDGSLLMNTGVLCTLGAQRPPNLTVVVLDNGIYESIGGHATLTSFSTDLALMATGAGCPDCTTVDDLDGLRQEVSRHLDDDTFGLIVVRLEPGIKRWPQPQRKPTDGIEDKYRFLRYIEQQEGIVIHPGAAQSHVTE